MPPRLTVTALQQMKRDQRKIVAVVLYDFQMSQIADRAGVDLVSVGDSVGPYFWGYEAETEVTLDQMVLACHAVSRGVSRAVVSCDVPLTSLKDGTDSAIRAARRLVKEGGAHVVKVDASASSADAIKAMVRDGIPVWAQFGTDPAAAVKDQLVREAKTLEAAGASLLDFRHSGPVAGPEVVRAVDIPVIGGLGGGPWLDGRVRALVAAIGYLAAAVDDGTERYANVAQIALSAITAFSEDVRAARQIRGAAPAVRTA
jgi:3-methyl-2-oxobutanoate hydroxymethyltransferase